MAQIPPISGPESASADDGPAAENRGSLDRKRPYVVDEDSSSEGRDPLRPRTLSWHPSAPVEPPLKTERLCSIGVDSILNPPSKAGPASSPETRGDPMAPAGSSHHRRLPSSPSVRLPSPALPPAKRLSLSPGSHQMIHPVSPSARFVNAAGPYPRKTSAPQSPLAQESRPGYMGAPGSPMVMDPAVASSTSVPGPPGPMPVSVQSTPTFHSRRTSANLTPNPTSQETSPTTPVSTFSHFGRASPALAGLPPPHLPSGLATSVPYATMESVSRLPPVLAGPRPGDEPLAMGATLHADPAEPPKIECFLDLKSGSSSQAEKRKANSDASRRFRNRKRNEMQMEQKIAAQQDEIRALTQDRDYYRAERDFYREHVHRLIPAGQPLPTRPASPQRFRAPFDHSSERDPQTTWPHATEPPSGPRASFGGPALAAPVTSSTRPTGSWSTASPSYTTSPAASGARGVLSHEQPPRSLPQFPGEWARV
ncbi:hypothetical protein BDW42DRAFT_12340 [Aspergillus taichungensis]|uniref:BZIP domain-containing protein n=1 Tax=Aspergillus taichungensis TaxID=482145 RepID=A0A2J5HJ38_9EURO|nr:hypothetical protein BDW42DRAFT_12340 [Aspergillus taichungensis]